MLMMHLAVNGLQASHNYWDNNNANTFSVWGEEKKNTNHSFNSRLFLLIHNLIKLSINERYLEETG